MIEAKAAAGETACGDGFGRRAAGERRQGRRHNTVLRVAVLAPEGGERRFCLVRNISDGGAMIEVEGALAGARAAIELQPKSIGCRIVWVRDRHAGLEFAAPTDWEGLLKPAAAPRKWRPRKPRIAVDRLAALRIGWTRHFVGIRDISQGGVRLDGDLDAAPGTALVVTLDGFGAVSGSLCWRGGGASGIAFNEALPLRALNRWLLAAGGPGRAGRGGGGL